MTTETSSPKWLLYTGLTAFQAYGAPEEISTDGGTQFKWTCFQSFWKIGVSVTAYP